MTAAAFEERSDPGQAASALLAAAVHVLLLLVLIFGVRWQSRPPESVVVELWNEPVAVQVPEEPKPIPRVEPAPLPAIKPEPVITKPEIVEKKAPPPKPVPKVEPKPKPKPEPPKAVTRPRDEEAQRQIRDQLQREQASFAIDRERQQIKDQLARDADAARNRALATWIDKIRIHIRSRIRVEAAQAVPGNPEAIFVVSLLPTYEVLGVSMTKSSGFKAYDEEIERAILKSSPLPRPDRPELFSRELKLTFRPRD